MNRNQIERVERIAERLKAGYPEPEKPRRRRLKSIDGGYRPVDDARSRFYEEANRRAEERRLAYLRFAGLKELLEIERRIVGVNEAGEWSRPESLATREKREKVYDFTDRQLELARKALGLA